MNYSRVLEIFTCLFRAIAPARSYLCSATNNKYFHDNIIMFRPLKGRELIPSDLVEGCHENHTRCWDRTRFAAFPRRIDSGLLLRFRGTVES